MFMDQILHFIHSFMLSHAPALLSNPIPLLVVATYLLGNAVCYFFTKGKEFAIVGWAAVLFLIPFIKIG